MTDAEMMELVQRYEIHLTPDEYADAIVARLSRLLPPPSRILEPCAGTGAFVKACRKYWPGATISAVDIIPEFEAPMRAAGADKVVIGDILSISARLTSVAKTYDLIISNPPFSTARQFAEALFPLLDTSASSRGRLAFLLRSAFLSTKGRRDFWDQVYDPQSTMPGLQFRLPMETRTTFKQPPGWPGLKGKDGKKRGSDSHEYEVEIWETLYKGPPWSDRPVRTS